MQVVGAWLGKGFPARRSPWFSEAIYQSFAGSDPCSPTLAALGVGIADPLQLGDEGHDARDQYGSWHKAVGQIGRDLIRRHARELGSCLETARDRVDRVMACDEDHAAPLQRDDVVVVRPVETIQVLDIIVGGYAWPLGNERVRGELAIGLCRELVLVPGRLVEQGEMGTAMD